MSMTSTAISTGKTVKTFILWRFVMEFKITKYIIADNGKQFTVGDDICFTIFNSKTNHHDKYIGRIRYIFDYQIMIDRVETDNGNSDKDYFMIDLRDIDKNSCNHIAD